MPTPRFEILRAPLDEDLRHLRRILARDGVAHRIFEDRGEQVLELLDPQDAPLAQRRIAEWRDGELPGAVAVASRAPFAGALRPLLNAPLVLVIALLAVAGAVIAWLRFADWMAPLVFQSTAVHDGGLFMRESGALLDRQWWKFFTPMFLHFGIFHLVFNLLWLFEFGARIEKMQSSARLLAIVLVSGLAANVCQFLHNPGALFGGLSGVVYGLFGYCFVHGHLYRPSPVAPRPQVALFLTGWLLVGMTGIISALGIANIANAAHLGGLGAGLLMGVLPPRTRR